MNVISRFTLRTLKLNKVRTVMTILGIILSVAMITAVATITLSFQNYLIESTTDVTGDWHIMMFGADESSVEYLKAENRIEDTFVISNLGYAKIESANEYKPYLAVLSVEDFNSEMLSAKLLSGRYPQSENEIIIPQHLAINGGVRYRIGDTLTLDLNKRYDESGELLQCTGYSEGEWLEYAQTASYTVVGMYERPDLEPFSAPGYTALTLSDNNVSGDIYVRFKNVRDVVEYFDKNSSKLSYHTFEYNNDYLRYSGAAKEDNINTMLYGVASIIMLVIVVGSYSLIYNAFSISINERTKHFGVLSSVGATKKQIRKSVLTEAAFLCAIGIPIGLISGVLGIAVTFMCVNPVIADSLMNGIELKVVISPAMLAVAALVGVITVLISAFVPAVRVMRMTTIEALRQSKDVKLTRKSLRTSRLAGKVFGFGGTLASKNVKRNKRKHRATIMSLFMSMVLFISISAFSEYMMKTVSIGLSGADYELSYSVFEDNGDYSLEEVYKALSQVDGVTEALFVNTNSLSTEITMSEMHSSYIEFLNECGMADSESDTIGKMLFIEFLSDEGFNRYAEKNGLDYNSFYDVNNPVAICYDNEKSYVNNTIYTHNILRESSGTLISADTVTNEATGEKISYEYEFEYVYKSDIIPSCYENRNHGIVLYYPMSMKQSVLGENNSSIYSYGRGYFKSDNHRLSEEKMSEILIDVYSSTSGLYNRAFEYQTNRALVFLVNVFAYGFIVLISLISLVNIFNTVSTNILTRRREFAVLKSVGMTDKALRKMMNYECLLYGIKSSVLAIPVSILISYFIYIYVSEAVSFAFVPPITGIVIAVTAVFAVVFITMLYSMSKLKKDNVIDTIKNEKV